MQNSLITIDRKFRPEIEGLRIVAAMLVAVYHIWFGRVSGGVDVFFVISGFLITTSIISTINRTHDFRFIPYIAKLLKRLLPSVFFILSFVAIFSYFFLPKSILLKTIKEIIASMLYYENWQLAFSNTDYLNAHQMKTPVEHFWAMSIQGQFYLIWFVLFAIILFCIKKFAIQNTRRFVNICLLTLFIASFSYSVYLTAFNQPFAYFITFTRVWEFALGGLLCVNLSYISLHKTTATLIGWIGFFGLLATGALFDVSKMFPGYVALWPMLCAVLIVLAGTRHSSFNVSRFLAHPIMIKLGSISFGIYLWHWVLLSFYKYTISTNVSLLAGLAIIGISIILSYLMTQLIEKPIRHAPSSKKALKSLTSMAMINVALISGLIATMQYDEYQAKEKLASTDYPGAAAANTDVEIKEMTPLPSFSTAFDDLPQSHLDKSNQNLHHSELKIGEYGNKDTYTKTIAVVGSSHSEQWLGAVLAATKDNPNYRVLNMTRSGTRLSSGYSDTDPKGMWVNNVMNYLKTSDVDLLITHGTTSDSENDTIQDALVEPLNTIKNDYGIDVLALRDNPRYTFSVLEMLETEGYDKTVKKMNAERNQLDEQYWQKLIKTKSNLHFVDFTSYFKKDGLFSPIIGNVVVYRDFDHMTNTYSESFAPFMKKEIDTILKSRDE